LKKHWQIIKIFCNSAKLLDKKYFEKVKIDEFGGITWDNGYDFCPNFLRELSEKP